MIIDVHTHIFPPEVAARRDRYLAADATFAEMYGNPKAVVAGAEQLLADMQKTGVDISVALGFAWRDHATVVRHNEYLLETAARSDGAIVPFTSVNMADPRAPAEIERCARSGVRGIGELRPENQGWDILGQAGQTLAALARQHNLVLMFHVTEPGVRSYPGRLGCAMDSFAEFARRNAGLRIIGAHLAGGVFTHDATPPDVYADTAAQPFLYREADGIRLMRGVPAGRLLFGSDYPLIGQRRQIDEVGHAFRDPAERDAVLGGNAARLLRLA